jgi:hypothetical protein
VQACHVLFGEAEGGCVTEQGISAKQARKPPNHLKEARDAAFLLARHVDVNDAFAHDVIKTLQHHLSKLEVVLHPRDP